jgi:hypothetical protein
MKSSPQHRRTLDVLASIGLPANTRVSRKRLNSALAALTPDRRREVVGRLQNAGLKFMASPNTVGTHNVI